MPDWTYTTEKLPPEGQVVTVLNGNVEQTLVFDRGLWWFPDRSMYVYFQPKLWRPLDDHNDGHSPGCAVFSPASYHRSSPIPCTCGYEHTDTGKLGS